MTGRLYLMPNTLDFGVIAADAAPDLREVLPQQAIDIAARLAYWVAEDARSTRAFLKRVGAIVPLALPLQEIRIDELPRRPKGGGSRPAAEPSHAPLLKPALEQAHDMGLISEAGLPAIADPGAALVSAAHTAGMVVVPLSGPSSLMLALAASGLNGQSFAFVGYLPVESGERTARLREMEAASRRQAQTQLIIETPYRNEALLQGLLAALNGVTRLSVSCGLTLPGGWTRTATVAQWRASPLAIPKDVPAVFCLLAS